MFWFFEVIKQKDAEFERGRSSGGSTGTQTLEPDDCTDCFEPKPARSRQESTAFLNEPSFGGSRSGRSRQQCDKPQSGCAPRTEFRAKPHTEPKPLPELKSKPSGKKSGDSSSNVKFIMSMTPKRKETISKIVAMIKEIGAWDDFSRYPIEITADGSTDLCKVNPNGGTTGAYTNGKYINLCDCFWGDHVEDQVFQLLHEWKHVEFRSQKRPYQMPWDAWEERECDMYAIKKLRGAGYDIQKIATDFVRPKAYGG